MPKVNLVPEAKPRDTNLSRVLLLLVNDSPNLLVPKAKPRNINNIFIIISILQMCLIIY